MTNKFRSEVEFPFGDKTYTVRPTFQVLANIEQTTGAPISTLLRRFVGQEFAARDIAFITFACLRETVPGIDLKMVSEHMEEDGLNAFIPPIMRLLTAAMNGSKKMSEMARAEAEANKAAEGDGSADAGESETAGPGPSTPARGSRSRTRSR